MALAFLHVFCFLCTLCIFQFFLKKTRLLCKLPFENNVCLSMFFCFLLMSKGEKLYVYLCSMFYVYPVLCSVICCVICSIYLTPEMFCISMFHICNMFHICKENLCNKFLCYDKKLTIYMLWILTYDNAGAT